MRVPAAVKRFTDPVVGRIRVPIASGVNRGIRWSLASAGSGYGSGRRAAQQMSVLVSLIRQGDVVWDVGAHHGYVALAAWRRVGRTGHVHAFEPSARNRWFLARHVRWNGADNVTIHPFALSSYDGEARFGGTGTSKMLALGTGENVVEVRAARSVIGSGEVAAPGFVKIDVEGAEADVLRGGLPGFGPDTRLMIAVHNAAAYQGCIDLLSAAGYHVVESRGLVASRRARWSADPDMVCFGPGWRYREDDVRVLTELGF